MKENFLFGVKAISGDIHLFMTNILHNKSTIGFAFGLLIATLVAGLIITKNPRHIPIILKYSSMEAFQKIAKRDKKGTYQIAFTNFIKMYTQLRTLVLILSISFFVMITTIVLTQ
ncbi:hypothetical protein KJ785_01375 [Patescibacteria group bacterium]|nr:hypothetical protein [Patescibacteria group bacterium]